MPVELKVPSVGESITEVEIGEWLKPEGATVQKDENVVALESEKATVELPAPVAGKLAKVLKQKGQTAAIGEVIGYLEPVEAPAEKTPRPESAPQSAPAEPPSAPSQPPTRNGPPATATQRESRVMPA